MEIIKKGMLGFDDYKRFGGFIDTLIRAGGKLFMYSPKKDTLTVICSTKDMEKVLQVIGNKIIKKKVRGGVAFVTTRW